LKQHQRQDKLDEPRSTKQTVKAAVGWIVGAAALTFCIAAIVRYWEQFARSGRELSVGVLAAGVACTLGGMCCHAAGWSVLIRGMSPGVRLSSALEAWAYSQVVKYVPGKVLVFVTRVEICGRDGAAPGTVLAGTGLEIILSLICALALAWPAAWAASPWACLMSLPVLLAAVHPKVIMGAMRFYYRLRKGDPDQAPRLSAGDILRPIVIYFVGWAAYALGGYLIFCSVLGAGPFQNLRGAVGVMGAFPFAWAAGYIVLLAPGGLGAREAALALAIAPWVPSVGAAAVVAVLARLCQSGLDLALGGSWWVGRRFARR